MSPRWLHWPASWTPADLADLAAWYKADAITGLSNNDPVSTWQDESANGYDATSTGSDRPSFVSSGLNGLPTVKFVNHTLNTGNIALFNGVDDYFAIAVRKITNAPSTGRSDIVGATFASDSSKYRMLLTVGLTTNKATAGARRINTDLLSSAVSAANYAVGSFVLHAIATDYQAGTVTQYIDAAVDGTNTFTSGAGESTNTDDLKFGRFSASNSPLDGELAEVVICDALLSSTDRQKLEGYLAHKWGLEANLPSTHPYRNSAP